MVTDVVVRPPQELEAFDPDGFTIPGMESVTPEELRIPILKLTQAGSKSPDAINSVGRYFNNVTGEYQDTVEGLIVGTAKGRVKMPKEYRDDNQPECASDNRQHPRLEFVGKEFEVVATDAAGKKKIVVVVIPKECAKCSFSQWVENPDGSKVPPPCGETETFAIMPSDGLPAIVQFKSTALSAVRNLKTMVVKHGITRAIVFRSRIENNAKGTYAVPVFVVGAQPDPAWQKSAVGIVKNFGNLAARYQGAAMESEAPPGAGNEIPEEGIPDKHPF